MLKNTDMFWKPHLALVTDVASFIMQLSKALLDYKARSLRFPTELTSPGPRGVDCESSGQRRRERAADSRSETAIPAPCLHAAAKSSEEAEFLNPVSLLQSVERLMSDNR
jgi:hypothetical protein